MMEVNIWSDVRCPFCYIGKHKFEKALADFEHKNNVKVTWHSFELDPNLQSDPEKSDLEHLSETKNMPAPQVKQMLEGARKMGAEIGLNLNFEKTKVANSFHAHRLIQLAKAKGLDNEMEEALFKIHFEEGQNIDDKKVLKEVGLSVGLREEDLDRMLFTDEFKEAVEKDKMDAARIGVRGVPFFVFNNRYAVSGAQPSHAFLEVLEKSFAEYQEQNGPLIINEGQSCDINGNCN